MRRYLVGRQLARSVEPIQGSWQSLSARAEMSALSLKESGIGGMSWPAGAAEPEPESSSSEAEEAAAAGVCEEDRLGNAEADAAAKAKARAADISPQLLQQWLEQQAAISAVWRLIAESQVAHLASRARRSDGTAAKSRKRKAPARPGRTVRRRAAAAGPRLLRLQRRRRQHWRHHREHH